MIADIKPRVSPRPVLTDVHCHILPGIDDGAPTPAESVAMLQRYAENGFTDIICTPHYIPGSNYCADNQLKRQLLLKLRSYCVQHDLPLRLHLGNEAYVDPELTDLIEAGQISTINRQYLLFELPLNDEISFLDKIVDRIYAQGYTPILAHPERYGFVQRDHSRLNELRDMGLALQSNYGSILGVYGEGAQETVEYMLRNDFTILLGTDAHRASNPSLANFHDAEQKIIDIVGLPNYQQIKANSNYLISDLV